MKVPASPPDPQRIWRALGDDRFLEILASTRTSATSGEYLPWDKLRFKTPPEGLTHEEWWLATRVTRQQASRRIEGLLDKAGHPFTYNLPDVVLRQCDEISRGASGQITISEQVTDAETRDRYVINSLIEEAITSSQLEGAVTSRRVAKDMLRTGRDPRNVSERMIFNNYVAMRRIVELKEQPLTPELVLEIHRIVTDGTLENPESAGKIQDDDAERISVWGDGDQLLHRPPPVAELPERLERLCAFANGDIGPDYLPSALRSITIHFMMGYDHYFEDGNGRTARALFYWSMLREGFWLAEFLTISKILKEAPAQYARSFLLTEQDDGDLTHFFIFHLQVITRAIAELHAYLNYKAEELAQTRRSLADLADQLNHRQLAVLEHVAKIPHATVTAASHALSHRVSEQSARNDLMALEQQGLLTRVKQGRKHAWVAATSPSATPKV